MPKEKIVFLDIDTQVDFMHPHGALYVPQAEQIIPKLDELMNFARQERILVLSTADAHPANDPSFAEWPPHCVIGTSGQKRIPQTSFTLPRVIRNIPGDFQPPVERSGQMIIEKTDYDVTRNPNFGALLKSIGRCRVVAFGVATDYCVKASVLSLRKLGVPVDLVQDAVRGVNEEASRKAINEMVEADVRLVTTAQVIASMAQPPMVFVARHSPAALR